MSEKIVCINQFRKKRQKQKATQEREKIRENAHYLIDFYIDFCEDDFAVILKSGNMKQYLEQDIKSDFIVAISDIEKTNINNQDHFFKMFGNPGNKCWFDLKGDIE